MRLYKRNKVWFVDFAVAGVRRRVSTGARDKRVAEERAAVMRRDAEADALGVGDPFRRHRSRPLTAHVEDFGRHLEAKNNGGARTRGSG